MTEQDFINKYTGQAGVGNTPENIGQCVGLVEVWIDNLGLAHVWGNAKDLLANADPTSYDVVYNAPANAPAAGDVVVWDGTWGNGNGHTGVVVSADPNTLQVFEQNDPTGAAPQVKEYSYAGVIGWLHPKAPPPTTDTAASDLAACLAQHTQLVDACNQKDAQIATQNQLIDKLNAQIAQLTTERDGAQGQVATLQPLADQLPGLQAQLAQAQHDRTVMLQAQETQNRTIAQLKDSSYKTASTSTLINVLLTRAVDRLTIRR